MSKRSRSDAGNVELFFPSSKYKEERFQEISFLQKLTSKVTRELPEKMTTAKREKRSIAVSIKVIHVGSRGVAVDQWRKSGNLERLNDRHSRLAGRKKERATERTERESFRALPKVRPKLDSTIRRRYKDRRGTLRISLDARSESIRGDTYNLEDIPSPLVVSEPGSGRGVLFLHRR